MLGVMADEAPGTVAVPAPGSAERRGVPLATIVVAAAVAIGLLDLNAALISGCGCCARSSSTS